MQAKAEPNAHVATYPGQIHDQDHGADRKPERDQRQRAVAQ